MLPSELYLYHSVVSISNVLKVNKIKLITQSALLRHMCHNSEPVKRIVLDLSPRLKKTKQCCHFFITKCKIFKLLVKPLFLRLFEPDQSEIKEIFYEIVNIHNVGNF